MLKKLIVTNLAVVERAEVDFAAGLNVITGETGAGKSVLMGALDLVLGGRADASVVREGAKEAEVEAFFDEHVIRRTLTHEGRSRAWIDDESVSVAELKELAVSLVDIHGPRANQRLVEESFQREALDAFAFKDSKLFDAYAEKWVAWSAVRDELEALKREHADEDEIELLRYQVNELASADLSEDDETIAERHAAAAHAEEIVENGNSITEGLGGDRGVAELMAALQPRFAAMARHLPVAQEWAAAAESITIELQELSRSVADGVSRLDAGDEDLKALDERLTVINRLKRKYLKNGDESIGSSEIARLQAVLVAKREKLERIEHLDELKDGLVEKLKAAQKALLIAGAALTRVRRPAALKLAKEISAQLRDLGFIQSEFSIAVEPLNQPERHGCDRITCLFAPNPGEGMRPLAAIASSGEIARVMLALKAVVTERVGTLVFDEVDANIGGEIGAITGAKLREVAKKAQVIAITHLPQSAVFGERHLRVAKAVSGGRTRTEIYEVSGEARVLEIARMLGGEDITSVVRKHAEELIGISR